MLNYQYKIRSKRDNMERTPLAKPCLIAEAPDRESRSVSKSNQRPSAISLSGRKVRLHILPPPLSPALFFLQSCVSRWQVLYRRGIADERTAARVKSLLACLHLSYRRIGVEVKVILQRVERLENIGKVRRGRARARSFFPSDNRMHTGRAQRKFLVVVGGSINIFLRPRRPGDELVEIQGFAG